MINFLIAMGAIFSLMMGWILIQQAARKFAAKYPQFGPAKEEGLGCGKNCGCQGGSCDKEQ
ncbi:hypothetical protein Q9L42_001225 [Methylomarinum sp. Ch1-1]|uniref:Chemotaxis protein n=1 Tax=Methylomarinum roseum TaxID=3067653 RepID=A0AAU7NUW8_9GAMM|nr:hypothetical protein [Methylomarinum sp. Ch1-1]MDP4519123.1 hypothetical protein [Methylomarinum sp. Ch1-1]